VPAHDVKRGSFPQGEVLRFIGEPEPDHSAEIRFCDRGHLSLGNAQVVALLLERRIVNGNSADIVRVPSIRSGQIDLPFVRKTFTLNESHRIKLDSVADTARLNIVASPNDLRVLFNGVAQESVLYAGGIEECLRPRVLEFLLANTAWVAVSGAAMTIGGLLWNLKRLSSEP
jgi:hypothetical protein